MVVGENLKANLIRVGWAGYLLNYVLNFREQVAELDISCKEQGSCANTAQMEFGMQKFKLNLWTGAVVPGNEVAEFSEDVSSDLHHVLMASRALQCFEYGLCGISLDIFTVYDDLCMDV